METTTQRLESSAIPHSASTSGEEVIQISMLSIHRFIESTRKHFVTRASNNGFSIDLEELVNEFKEHMLVQTRNGKISCEQAISPGYIWGAFKNFLISKHRWATAEKRSPDDNASDPMPQHAESPANIVANNETRDRVIAIMKEKLSAEQYQIVMLHADGYRHKEIAERLYGDPSRDKRVASQLHQARRILKPILEKKHLGKDGYEK